MTIQDIPAINASLNGLATILLTGGFICIWRKKILAHRAFMMSASVVSAFFLVGYVTHKALKGMAAGAGGALHTQFGGEGPIRTVYYVMLLTHILLAIAIAFLVPRTLYLAIKGDFVRHRAWAKWTFPIWYYVSITGVLVYFFLYQWWPAPAGFHHS